MADEDEYIRLKAGGMEYISVSAVGGEPDITIVMLHGYGSSPLDCLPLAAIFPERQIEWYMPYAPHIFDVIPDLDSRSWLPLEYMEVLDSICQGNELDRSIFLEEELNEICARLRKMVEALGVSYSSLLIGGFGPSAVVATHFGLTTPEPILGMLLSSGTLITGLGWDKLARERVGTTFVQTHGIYDNVFSVLHARLLNKLLVSNGMMGFLNEYPCAHEMIPDAIGAYNQYISQLLLRRELNADDYFKTT